MRVSLQIDGDASGAQKAAKDAADAVGELGKNASVTAGHLKEASDTFAHLAGASQAAGAANDNLGGAAVGLLSKFSELITKAKGVDSSLAKAASGATDFAGGLTKLAAGAGGFTLLTGSIGLAITAASTFYDIINKGSKTTGDILAQQAKQIAIVQGAYSGAADTAGKFYEQSKLVTQLMLTQNTIDLRKQLQTEVGAFLSQITTYGGLGDIVSGTREVVAEFRPFEDIIIKLKQGFKDGSVEAKEFVDQVGKAIMIDPAARLEAGTRLIDLVQKPLGTFNRIKANVGAFDHTNGQATAEGDARAGIAAANANASAGALDRLGDAMDRQSKAQLAEAQTAGLSAGAIATLRGEFVLTEAAQQAGLTVAGAYADKIKAIADRAGDAAQKLALARLQSDTAFNRDQLGRSTIDASVADQLRGAFGNNADLTSTFADAVRLNETMKDLKATTIDLSSGAFRDFRTEVQSGTNALDAMGKAGVNAFNKIIDKLGDKTLDKFISAAFGSFDLGGIFGIADPGSSAKPLAGLTAADYGPGFDIGGYTGAGGRKQPAGIVHRGEVVWSQDDVAAHGGAGMVDAMRRMRRGYDVGGVVGGGSGGGSLSSGGGPQHLHVTVSVDRNGELKAFVQDVSNTSANKMVVAYVEHPSFVSHIAETVKLAQTNRML